MNKLLPALLLSLTFLGCAAPARAQTPAYKVGAAKELITPCTGRFRAANLCSTGYIHVDAYDVDLLGAGPGDTAEAIHTDLWVRALAIEDQATGRQVVLVGVDTAVFERSFIEEVRGAVRGYAGLRPEEVMINASHTHAAPSLMFYCPGASCPTDGDTSEGIDNAAPDPDYVDGVKEKIVAAIKAAMDNLTPASLYFGTGTSNIGKYRRADATQHPQPNHFCIPQAGPTSNVAYPQKLDVLEARTSGGQVLATAFFVGTHPVNMMNGKTVSADYVHPAREHVESHLHNSGSTGAMAIFFQGFGGDLNPRRWNFQTSTTTNDETGEELGDDVLRVRGGMTAPLGGALQVSTQVQYLGLDPAGTPWTHNGDAFLPTEVQTVTVGSGADGWSLVGVGHEVLSEYASYFRNAWPDPSRVTLAGYSNGVKSYVPNERVLQYDRAGGVSTSHFEGYMAIRSYGVARPDWSNSDLLSAPKGGTRPRSLALDGTNDYARVPSGAGLNVSGALTLEAWIKVNSHGAQRGIVERFGPFGSTTDGGYDLRVTADGKLHFFIGYDTNNTATYDYLRGGTTISTGVWHHVAGVYDPAVSGPGEMRVYLDGALDGSKSTNAVPGTGTSDLIIGAFGNTASAGFFNGSIDEVRVTAGELYTGAFTPRAHLASVAGTVGLWKFNGTLRTDPVTGDPVSGDSSVEGNHARLKGGATYSDGIPRDAVPSGAANNSLALNFPTAYVDVPDGPTLDMSGAFTLEAWIKTDAKVRQQGIVERLAPYGTDGDSGYNLRIGADGRLSFFLGDHNNVSGDSDHVTGSTVVTAGVWHHVAGVYEPGTGGAGVMRVYLDGALDGSKTTSVAPGGGSSHLLLGVRGYDAAYDSFSGLIDEVRVTGGAVYTSNFTPSAQLTAGTGTRGLWKFDGQTALDTSGNGNDGTLVGGAGHSADVPAAGSSHALSLNGTQSRVVSVPDSPTLDVAGPLTLEAWVNVGSNTVAQGIAERFGPFGSTTDGGYDLRITAQGKLSFFIGYDTSSAATHDVLVGGTTLTTNVWHHVAGVYDGYEIRVYVDGVLDGSKATTKSPGLGTYPLYIGAHGSTAANGYFSGLIDEVRLTAGVVYTCPFVPTQHLPRLPGTRGLWKFDGQSLSDSSGNGNHATPLGTAAYSTSAP